MSAAVVVQGCVCLGACASWIQFNSPLLLFLLLRALIECVGPLEWSACRMEEELGNVTGGFRCSVDRRPATAGKTMKLGQAQPTSGRVLAQFARVSGRLGNRLAGAWRAGFWRGDVLRIEGRYVSGLFPIPRIPSLAPLVLALGFIHSPARPPGVPFPQFLQCSSEAFGCPARMVTRALGLIAWTGDDRRGEGYAPGHASSMEIPATGRGTLQ